MPSSNTSTYVPIWRACRGPVGTFGARVRCASAEARIGGSVSTMICGTTDRLHRFLCRGLDIGVATEHVVGVVDGLDVGETLVLLGPVGSGDVTVVLVDCVDVGPGHHVWCQGQEQTAHPLPLAGEHLGR